MTNGKRLDLSQLQQQLRAAEDLVKGSRPHVAIFIGPFPPFQGGKKKKGRRRKENPQFHWQTASPPNPLQNDPQVHKNNNVGLRKEMEFMLVTSIVANQDIRKDNVRVDAVTR